MVRASMIHHMNVPIDDIGTARDFYGRVLGLAEIKRPDVGRPGLWFGCGANELHLSVQPALRGGRTAMSLQPTDRPDRAGGHVAFTMSGSLDDIARCLEAERIPYARGRAGLPQIFCEDPAGNLVELNTGWTQQPLG
jgi:glyoxylase I family protein